MMSSSSSTSSSPHSTGRLASDRPNLQTVPRVRALMLLLTQSQHSSPNNNIDNNTTINNNATTTISSPPRRQLRTVVANVRKAFIVPPGYIMMSADYKQLELRMAAHLAGDAHLQNSLREEDPFSALAASQQRIPVTAVSPEARNAAKAVAYGLLYGKGMLALARDMQCDVEEARRIHDELWAMMPRVRVVGCVEGYGCVACALQTPHIGASMAARGAAILPCPQACVHIGRASASPATH